MTASACRTSLPPPHASVLIERRPVVTSSEEIDATLTQADNSLMLAETDILDRVAATATLAERHLYYGVSWDAYLRLLDDLGDDRPGGIRLTYMDGILEIMSPKRLHEQLTRMVDMVLTVMAFELELDFDNCGAMTMRLDPQEKGGEPDSCFYLANEPAVRGLTEIDLLIHPPPDIVLEIDITSPSLDKMRLYHAACVPEVWRYDGAEMRFLVREEDAYRTSTRSRSFPHLTSERLSNYLTTGRKSGARAMLQKVKDDI